MIIKDKLQIRTLREGGRKNKSIPLFTKISHTTGRQSGYYNVFALGDCLARVLTRMAMESTSKPFAASSFKNPKIRLFYRLKL